METRSVCFASRFDSSRRSYSLLLPFSPLSAGSPGRKQEAPHGRVGDARDARYLALAKHVHHGHVRQGPGRGRHRQGLGGEGGREGEVRNR